MKKFLSILLAVLLSVSALCLASCSDPSKVNPPEKGKETIAILYENDVHCEIDGYTKLAAMKKELAGAYDHVGVVCSGDFVQGGTIGAVSKGEYIVKVMNEVGYDAVALGNHEFDYKLPRLMELNDMSNTKFLSCNFTKYGETKTIFDGYSIVSYGDTDIAYIGITTPDTISSSFPAQFKDENGKYIYSFNEANLYEMIQTNIDSAKNAGADYVIALSHVGYDEEGIAYDITDVIENTDGFDVVLDAHSHSVIEKETVKDKSGDDVILSSTGTLFEYIGKLTITESGLNTELIKTETYTKTDATVDALIEEINVSYAELGNRKIGESLVTLNTHDGDIRLMRNNETALGNFCSDAFRIVTGADIAYLNGGGLRTPIEVGDVRFNDIYSIMPFNNSVVTARVTGQVILDMLEMAVSIYPEEAGMFPHMSGLTFCINKSIPSSVKLDSKGFFIEVDGEYRVYNVQVLDKESGTYKPLELDATYVVAGQAYHIVEFGEGLSMFKDAEILDSDGNLDIDVLEKYIVETLGGVIGEKYAAPEGRIKITDGFIQ